MPLVRRVVASNPGPYTGPGTNTWLVGEAPAVIVIDPGPDEETHLDAIEGRLQGVPVGAIVVTHGHPDHAPLAPRLAQRHHARVLRYPELTDGDLVRAGKVSLTALHTPGHSPDHLVFWLPEDRVAFTGDLVLGQGSTMITYPEGDMAAYLQSLDRLAELEPRMLFPGHWDPVMDPAHKLAEYRQHRLDRESQILKALGEGALTAEDLVQVVYAAEVGDSAALLAAAGMTLRAHLRKLVDEGRVREDGDLFRAA